MSGASDVQPIISIVAGTIATGAGTALDCIIPRTFVGMQVNAAASTSGGVVALEGSMDNVNWGSLATVTLSTSGVSFIPPSSPGLRTPVRWVRANITTTITGGSVQVLVSAASV